MSSLTAECAGLDSGPEQEITKKGVRLVFVSFSRICHFQKHPFRLYTGERFSDMVESIRQNGILMPLIIRRIFGDPAHDYEMLSGHNRMNAGQSAGLEGAWCVVKEGLSDAEAMMYVIETNLLQRSFSDLLPSEKAAVLALRYSEMFSQGKRNDIQRELEALERGSGTCGSDFHKCADETCGSDFHKSKNRDVLGEDYALTGRQVATYLRINRLYDGLKLRLDEKLLTQASAVSLSYLNNPDQLAVHAALLRYQRKPADAQMAAVRKLAETGPLTEGSVMDLLQKKASSPPKALSIQSAVYTPYFASGTPKKEIERVIGEALALYFSQPREESA
jgi:ParB family chromosome partitioning protein